MNKRITSLLLCFVMVFTMLAAAVPALAAGSTSFNINPDKTEAHPGDTISYTISLGAVTNLRSIKIKLSIPEGLTYVAGSGKTPDGLEETLNNAQKAAFTESTKVFIVATAAGYTSTTDTLLMEFKCTVNEGASGNKAIDLIIDPDDIFDTDYDNIGYVVNSPAVTITTPHAHVYDQTSTDAAHLKTPATCTEAAVYYKSCTCGENGTETFTSGSALGHDYTKKVENNTYLKTAASNCTEYNVYWYACSRCDANAKDDAAATDKYYTSTTAGNHSFTEKIEDAAHYVAGTGTDCQSVKKYYYDCAYCDLIGTTTWDSTTYGPHNYAATWSSDADGHWHECSLCHGKKDEAAHTPDREAATETEPVKCSECDYEIAPALGMADYTIDLPVSIAVKLTGDKKPGKETFKFEIYDLGVEDAAFEIVNDTVVLENLEFDENGVAFIGGMLKIKVTGEDQLFNLTEGFKVRMVKGTAKGWTYASEQWCVNPIVEMSPDGTYIVYDVREIVDGEISEIPANGMSFSLGYEAVTEPETPQTGDNSVMGLWIALLVVSGAGVVATAVYGKKRKSVK